MDCRRHEQLAHGPQYSCDAIGLGKPDPDSHHFRVKLSRQQVKDSPDIDTAQPVSRQNEAHVYEYYGWSPYWANSAPAAAGPLTKLGDAHLRSVGAVTGHHVHATDGEIGHVADFLVDEASWNIPYIVVDTENWWPGEKSPDLAPLGMTNQMGGGVDRPRCRSAESQGSPPYISADTVDGAYDEKFLTYYGIKWVRIK